MPTDTFVQNFVISKISRSKFEELSSSGMLNENEFYLIEDPQIDAGNQPIVNVSAPSSGTDAANKDYVDGASSAIAADIATLSSAMSSKADQSAFAEFASTTSASLSALNSNKANLDSPTFTGTPTAPTASSGTSSTQIATTAFVQGSVESKSVLHVIADLDISTLTISNPSVPFSDALAAYQSGRTVLLSLKYSNTPSYLDGFVINVLDSILKFGIIIDFQGEPSMVLAFWSSSGWETTIYALAQLPDSIFHVHGELDLSTMSISNIDQPFSIASSAAEMGRTVFLTLNTGDDNNYHSFAFYTYTNMMIFQFLIYVSLGYGNHPYLLQAKWYNWYDDEEWQVDYYTLVEQSDIDGKADNDIIAPEFSTGQNYNVGDAVIYDGVRYVCHTAIVNAQSWTGVDNWSEQPVQMSITNVEHNKLDSVAGAPDFNPSSTYFVGEHVTYLGKLYRCTTAVTASGAWTGSTNWTETDMTSPDATVDIMTGGELRVVAADGTILWMQGYDLGSASSLSGTSMTLDNEALNAYNFVVNSTDQISLALPTAPSGKVGDFIIDIYNPSIGDAFSESSTYSSGTQTFYNGDLYSCTAAVETAGAWTGSTNWALVASAFNSSSDYSSGTNVVYEDAIWKCQTSSVSAGSWTGTDDWQTASFIIPQWENNNIGIVIPAGEDLQEMLTFAPGTMCELYFTQTAFHLSDKPTWKVVRQDVESGGAS